MRSRGLWTAGLAAVWLGCAPGSDPGSGSYGDSNSDGDSASASDSATDSASSADTANSESDAGVTSDSGGSDSNSAGDSTTAGTTDSTTADSDSDTDIGAGTDGSTGAASAGSTGNMSSASDSDSASTGEPVNPLCEPMVQDHPCVACAREFCCDFVVACLLDNVCLCLAQCVDGGDTFEACEMQCGQSTDSTNIQTCAQSNCVACN